MKHLGSRSLMHATVAVVALLFGWAGGSNHAADASRGGQLALGLARALPLSHPGRGQSTSRRRGGEGGFGWPKAG
jgi:hypothetical protein